MEILNNIFENIKDASNYKSELNEFYSNSDNINVRKSIEDILSNKTVNDIDFFSLLDDKIGAIRLACLEDLFHTIKYFDEMGADFHELDFSDNNCIHWASESGSVRILDFMIEKNVNLHQKNYIGDTGLIGAVSKNHIEIVKRLVNLGLNVNDSSKCINVLNLACDHGYKELIDYFVETVGVDIFFKDKYDRNALHYACLGGFTNIAEFLIDKGMNVQELDTYKMNCLHMAACSGSIECIEMLIEKGNYLKSIFATIIKRMIWYIIDIVNNSFIKL